MAFTIWVRSKTNTTGTAVFSHSLSAGVQKIACALGPAEGPLNKTCSVRDLYSVNDASTPSDPTPAGKDLEPALLMQALDEQSQVDKVRLIDVVPVDPDLRIQRDLPAGEMLAFRNTILKTQLEVIAGLVQIKR